MGSVITIAGEKLFAAKAQANQQLDIDTFIFANVPGQDPTAPIDREEPLPPQAQIVHQQVVQQVGRINENVVVYSTVLDSVTGPFEFNWVGLYSSVNQTLVAINHVPTVAKTVTGPGVAGNTLNRNFGIEYSGIADLTGITVAPETWQLDFTARLSGMDELTRQLAKDMNGSDWFIENGFLVVPTASPNQFSVTAGVGYVSGLRVELENEQFINAAAYPQFVYIDAYFDGSASSMWKPQLTFNVTADELDDYTDANGVQHYVFKLAVLNADGDVKDLRKLPAIVNKAFLSRNSTRKFTFMSDALQGEDFKKGDIIEISSFDSDGFGKSTWVGTGNIITNKAGTFERQSGKIYGLDGSECTYKYKTLVIPEQWGCKPNNSSFDNEQIFFDINTYLPDNGAIFLQNLQYYAKNLFWLNKKIRVTSLIFGSELCSINEGEKSKYIHAFSAPKTWVDNNNYVSKPLIFSYVTINGGDKKIAHVNHYYFGRHDTFNVKNGTEISLMISAKSQDGTPAVSTMVNNKYRNLEISGSAKKGLVVDEDGKSTDWEIDGAYIYNSGESNAILNTLGGALFTNVHLYGSPVSLSMKKWNVGTRINNIYAENDVVINEGLDSKTPLCIGPNLKVLGNLNLNFGAVSGDIKSSGNSYAAKINHNSYTSKKMISTDDYYKDSSPFVFSNETSGNPASFILEKALVKGKLISGEITTTSNNILNDDYLELPATKSVNISKSQETIAIKFKVSNVANSTESFKVEVVLTGQYNSYQNFGRSVATFIITSQVKYNNSVSISIDEVNRDDSSDYTVTLSGSGTIADGVTVTITPTVNAAHNTGVMQATITHKLQGSNYGVFA
ncbi:phage tail-collar fiber domain-containing protein [Shewanella algae]|uniref:phage tail-collar fiber domain-containing protein n=1 Tax=Shewanella algae TaxID=38313 RepID=UPI001183D5CC|nr:phage tail protein [Shewanella algae]TVL14757.1 hypothetical protein AYJ02_11870 [Shewanella algae]